LSCTNLHMCDVNENDIANDVLEWLQLTA
jgi:hypothetical protein